MTPRPRPVNKQTLLTWFNTAFSPLELQQLANKLLAVPNQFLLNNGEQKSMAALATLPAEQLPHSLPVIPFCQLLALLITGVPNPNSSPTDILPFIGDHYDDIRGLLRMDQTTFTTLLARLSPLFQPVPTLIGMSVQHQTMGAVLVSAHAWQRFCERHANPNHIAAIGRPRCLVKLFGATTEETLSKPLALARLLNNGVQSVRYFRHNPSRLRFVVHPASVLGELAILLTIEQIVQW